jgi:hypothetical protein
VPTHRSIEQKRIDQEDPNFSLSSCGSNLSKRAGVLGGALLAGPVGAVAGGAAGAATGAALVTPSEERLR